MAPSAASRGLPRDHGQRRPHLREWPLHCWHSRPLAPPWRLADRANPEPKRINGRRHLMVPALRKQVLRAHGIDAMDLMLLSWSAQIVGVLKGANAPTEFGKGDEARESVRK